MNCTVTIDWKFVAAVGGVVVASIFAIKMDAPAAERVSMHALDTCKDYAVAMNSNC